MNLNFQFANQHVLVTGGGQGIGFEISKRFVEAGARLTIWDYSDEALLHAEKEMAPFAERVTCCKVDITDYVACHTAAEQLKFPLDILVNNAGITRDKSFAKLGLKDFNDVISTNLNGAFNVTKSCYPFFGADSQCKRIINIASIVGIYGNFGQTNYAAAKAGLLGMTKTLSRELARKGFTVNAVAPGFIETKMTAAMPKEVLTQMQTRIPVGRLGSCNDIANACLFLASAEAGYINGHTLSVDGALVL